MISGIVSGEKSASFLKRILNPALAYTGLLLKLSTLTEEVQSETAGPLDKRQPGYFGSRHTKNHYIMLTEFINNYNCVNVDNGFEYFRKRNSLSGQTVHFDLSAGSTTGRKQIFRSTHDNVFAISESEIVCGIRKQLIKFIKLRCR